MGHPAGDALLHAVGTAITAALRDPAPLSAEPRPLHRTAFQRPLNHEPYHVGRNRKSDAERAAAIGEDRRVDADQLAVLEQRDDLRRRFGERDAKHFGVLARQIAAGENARTRAISSARRRRPTSTSRRGARSW